MRPTNIRIIAFVISILLLSSISLWIYHSFVYKDVWSIGIYAGTDPYDFIPHPLVHSNPVLTADDVKDVPASYVADPFMIYDNDKWYMFFEVLNSSSGQGDIGLASSKNGIDWEYEQIVLDEPFHLSYPYVFKWDNSYYMIPESRGGSAVKLYKATKFPINWTFIGDLIIGKYADPSIVYKDDIWWLFVLRGYDTLALYYANNLIGPWIEHPKSPLIAGDNNISRPGGRIIAFDNKIIRYVQDGDPTYGNAVRAFQVDVITATSYKDHEISKSPILAASGSGWNSIGMHHVDPHQLNDMNWIISVDGNRGEKVFNLKAGAGRLMRKTKDLFKKITGYTN